MDKQVACKASWLILVRTKLAMTRRRAEGNAELRVKDRVVRRLSKLSPSRVKPVLGEEVISIPEHNIFTRSFSHALVSCQAGIPYSHFGKDLWSEPRGDLPRCIRGRIEDEDLLDDPSSFATIIHRALQTPKGPVGQEVFRV